MLRPQEISQSKKMPVHLMESENYLHVLAVLLILLLLSQFLLLLRAIVAPRTQVLSNRMVSGVQNYWGVSAATLFRFVCVPCGVFVQIGVLHASGVSVKTAACPCFSSSVRAKIQQYMFFRGAGN